ncbi:MAG: DNA-protecting protein DprA, partial [Caldimonas sp.]
AGREVFAIPGSIHSPLSRGCHALIKQGAKLVECAEDVLEEMKSPTTARATATSEPVESSVAEDSSSLPADDRSLLDAIGFDPMTLDALVARTGTSAASLSVRLLDLELGGHVARLPGQRFQRIRRA